MLHNDLSDSYCGTYQKGVMRSRRVGARMPAAIEWVPVSPEMTTLIGVGPLGDAPVPAAAALLRYSLGADGGLASLAIVAEVSDLKLGDDGGSGNQLTCIVARDALDRLFGWCPLHEHGRRYHLTSDLRVIMLAIVEAPMADAPREAYRIGKSIELLCETMRAFAAGALVPIAAEGSLSLADSRRLVAARRIIDKQWAEKLTLDSLARACGINRAKLTRGFRELYHCSVAEAIAERRLIEARRKLLTTDLPVSSIGYASGYLNNASFSRAFGRRFGVSPSAYRGCASAAA